MVYRIATQAGYLRAELFHRESTEQGREFFGVVAESATRHRTSRVLISVHSSSPVFTVERSGFLEQFRPFGADPRHKIALVADSDELNHSHEYLELVSRQQGINVRHFRDERSALVWFRSQH